MLEDSNAAGILELTKEKLAGQIVAGKFYSLVFIFSSFCVVGTLFGSAKLFFVSRIFRLKMNET